MYVPSKIKTADPIPKRRDLIFGVFKVILIVVRYCEIVIFPSGRNNKYGMMYKQKVPLINISRRNIKNRNEGLDEILRMKLFNKEVTITIPAKQTITLKMVKIRFLFSIIITLYL